MKAFTWKWDRPTIREILSIKCFEMPTDNFQVSSPRAYFSRFRFVLFLSFYRNSVHLLVYIRESFASSPSMLNVILPFKLLISGISKFLYPILYMFALLSFKLFDTFLSFSTSYFLTSGTIDLRRKHTSILYVPQNLNIHFMDLQWKTMLRILLYTRNYRFLFYT